MANEQLRTHAKGRKLSLLWGKCAELGSKSLNSSPKFGIDLLCVTKLFFALFSAQ